jgi:hypothetical protein
VTSETPRDPSRLRISTLRVRQISLSTACVQRTGKAMSTCRA